MRGSRVLGHHGCGESRSSQIVRRRFDISLSEFTSPGLNQRCRNIVPPRDLGDAGTGRESLRQDLQPLLVTPTPAPRIEQLLNKLKNWRRVATRYDKIRESYLGFVTSARHCSEYPMSTNLVHVGRGLGRAPAHTNMQWNDGIIAPE